MEQKNMKSYYCPLAKEDHSAFLAGARRVSVPAGGMILWNSETVHQGYSYGPRLTVPICYEPKERRCAEALAAKKKCCFFGIPTTHWASLGTPHPSYSRLFDTATSANETPSDSGPLIHRAHKHLYANSAPGMPPTLIPYIEALL